MFEKSLTASNFMEVTYVVPYFSSECSRLALNNIQYNYEDINLYYTTILLYYYLPFVVKY